MATENDHVDDTNGDGDDEGASKLRSVIKDLEKKNKALEDENNGYKGAEKLRSAGLGDLSERQIKALHGALDDGDSSPESMRKAAEELGFVQPEPETPQEVQDAQQRITGASQTGQIQPNVSAEDEYAAATTPEEVLAVARKHGNKVASDYD